MNESLVTAASTISNNKNSVYRRTGSISSKACDMLLTLRLTQNYPTPLPVDDDSIFSAFVFPSGIPGLVNCITQQRLEFHTGATKKITSSTHYTLLACIIHGPLHQLHQPQNPSTTHRQHGRQHRESQAPAPRARRHQLRASIGRPLAN
jgi:hypothetical protein